MFELNLLGKTEIWVENVRLKNVNLNDVAGVVSEVLGLGRDEVMVTDVRESCIVLDVLRKTVYAEQIFGKKKTLLRRLSELPGLTITGETTIHSEGILGLIALDEGAAREAIERSKQMVREIREKISRRAIVFSTGFEVRRGLVEDTNTPMIVKRLEEEGYQAVAGPTLEDDESRIASKIWDAAHGGFGLVVITGGVGAEDKDRTVEGILIVDPKASTPYITKFEVGKGRHAKDGVRIAVGRVGDTTIVALPGPTDEVRLGLEAVVHGVAENLDKSALANRVATVLRKRLRDKMTRSSKH